MFVQQKSIWHKYYGKGVGKGGGVGGLAGRAEAPLDFKLMLLWCKQLPQKDVQDLEKREDKTAFRL